MLGPPLPCGRGRCAERCAGRNEAGTIENADESADFIIDDRCRWCRAPPREGESGVTAAAARPVGADRKAALCAIEGELG